MPHISEDVLQHVYDGTGGRLERTIRHVAIETTHRPTTDAAQALRTELTTVGFNCTSQWCHGVIDALRRSDPLGLDLTAPNYKQPHATHG